MYILLFVLGFVLLVLGADWLVDGGSSIGKKLNIPSLVIGLTIVALGTSLPELIISVFAALQGNTDLAIANVIGSNIMNVLVILGISALVFPISAGKGSIQREIPFGLFTALLLGVFMVLNVGTHMGGGYFVSRMEGVILLVFFCFFLYYSYKIGKSGSHDDSVMVKEFSVLKSAILIVVGIAALYGGGRFVIASVEIIGAKFGLSQSVIGITLVAFSTSLPELITSVVAALKRNSEIALGNVVGSNLFNILFVLGVSSTIMPLPVYFPIGLDLSLLILSNIILFAVMFTGSGRRISRVEGVVFLLIYIIYLVLRFTVSWSI